MANRFYFEALNRSLRDILCNRFPESCEKPFGGLTVVLGGDFRQILPVIPKGRRADIVDASLNSSYLWKFFTIFELKQNMRLSKANIIDSKFNETATFDEWLLQIGDSSCYYDVENELVEVPSDILLEPIADPIKAIAENVYPHINEKYHQPEYLKERAILTPKNETVYLLNDFIMQLLPGEPYIFLSLDTICKANYGVNDEDMLYTIEFLNGMKIARIPNHDLC
ncbi:DNA helicase Pif1-like, partial [Parasponia andersonii]